MAHTQGLSVDFKDDPKMRLNMNDVFAVAETATNDMTALVKSIHDLPLPCETRVFRLALDGKISAYEKSMLQVRRYLNGLKALKLGRAKGLLERKRGWRSGRDTYLKAVKDGCKNHAAVPKLVADSLMCMKIAPTEANLQITFAERLFDLAHPESGTDEYLEDARLLPAAAAGVVVPHWSSECARFLVENKDEIAACATRVEAALGANPCAFTSFAPKTAFKIDAAAGDKRFPDAIQAVPILGVQVGLASSPLLKCWPTRGIRCLLTAVSGDLVVVILSQVQLTENHDTAAWLKAEKSDALANNDCMVVKQGRSLLIPFGATPVIMCCKTIDMIWDAGKCNARKAADRETKKAAGEKCVWLAHYILDPEKDKAAPPLLRKAIVANIVSAGEMIPDTLRGQMQPYKAALEEPAAAAP